MPRRLARLVVDPTRCRGHGTCAVLLPDHIKLDKWQYPLLTDPTVDLEDRSVVLAIRLCPELALHAVELDAH